MIAIRILRDGVAVREQIFLTLPVRIGRSSACHLILTDQSVSRDHARIVRDSTGAVVLVDESGTNGLYAGPRRVESEPVAGRLRARLGLVEIEIEEVSADATSPITLEDLHHLDQRRTPLTWAKYVMIALLPLIIEAALMPEFWSPWNSQRAVSLVWMSASALVAILVVGSLLLGLLKAAGRKIRMADVLKHFAVFLWLRPLAVAISLLAYYVVSDGFAGALRSWLPALSTVAFLTQAAALRRPGPNGRFRTVWAVTLVVIMIGVEWTQAYAARRMGQPEADHAMQAPLVGPGPAVSFDAYAAAVEAAGRRSEDQVR